MSDSLERYREKRNFAVTPEPSPETRPVAAGTATYLIQKHAARRLHYDFRLALNGVLKSWAVTKGPSLVPGEKRLAVETEDHPIAYGDFEGVIPKGEYGGGTVMLWDRGTWHPVDGKDAEEGLRAGSLTFELDGERLKGRWHLQRLKSDGKRVNWLLIKGRDDAAASESDAPVTERFDTSVATGRTMDEIAKSKRTWSSTEGELNAPDAAPAPAPSRKRRTETPLRADVPAFVEPELCISQAEPSAGEAWLSEIKYDGYRMLLRAAPDGVTLRTRNDQDWSDRFASITAAAAPLREGAVLLDGEVVVFDPEGRPDFGLLQRALGGGEAARPVYVAFDCLFEDGVDVRAEPLEDRKARVKAIVDRLDTPLIRYGDHIVGKGPALFDRACAMGLEGVILKRAGSPYRSGRGHDWIKVRCTRRDTFVIGGFTIATDNAAAVGALLLGRYEDGALVYSGKVGAGLTTRAAQELKTRLESLARKTHPFANKPPGMRDVTWVRPDLAAEIEYLTVTEDGMLRHASFKGLREDLSPQEAASGPPDRDDPNAPAPAEANGVPDPAPPTRRTPRSGKPRERGEIAGVRLTSPDKVLFPEQGVTKQAIAEHYLRYADLMLPHVAGRPLMLVRCPEGRAQTCFHQRHPGQGLPDRMAVDIGDPDGPAIVVERIEDVIELVQRGVLEIHPRGARADRPDRPDRVIFDLDPGEDVPFNAVKAAALLFRERLAGLGLESFLRATGGKGLHIVAPIERRYDWPTVKGFALAISEAIARERPEAFLVNMAKARRHGKIFIDYLRNDRKSSAIASFSTRARPGAPFALPVAWENLPRLESATPVHVGEPLPFGDADPWAGIETLRQRFGKAALAMLAA